MTVLFEIRTGRGKELDGGTLKSWCANIFKVPFAIKVRYLATSLGYFQQIRVAQLDTVPANFYLSMTECLLFFCS